MKKFLYLLILISTISCWENATSAKEQTKGDEPGSLITREEAVESPLELKTIEDIKTEYLDITSKLKNGHLDSTSFKYDCNGEKAGSVIYFSENDQLRLIRHTYNEYSHFSATKEYFLRDSTAFFVFYNLVSWNFTGPGQTTDNVTEKRYYLLNNEPVKCLQKEYTINSDEEIPGEEDMGPKKEIQCPTMDSLGEEFEMLLKYRNAKEGMDCLEK